MVARDLLTDSGSIFVQIGDENVHRVRAVMDEVFGENNFIRLVSYATTSGLGNEFLDKSCDFIVWYAKDISRLKYRSLFFLKYDKDLQNSPYSLIEENYFLRRRMTKIGRAHV